MPLSDSPCLRLAIARLTAAEADHYAVWVLQAPYPGGYVHHDRHWPATLSQAWQGWQSLFSLRNVPDVPRLPSTYTPQPVVLPPPAEDTVATGQPTNYTSQFMQHLGVELWKWLFDGSIQSSLDQSLGIAIGQNRQLRLRLEIRDPRMIALPWEIMQSYAGRQAISLSQQILFSRTTSDVDPLPMLRSEQSLKILLVLGQDTEQDTGQDAGQDVGQDAEMDGPQAKTSAAGNNLLQLEQEAEALAQVLKGAAEPDADFRVVNPVACAVTKLLQPTPAELIQELESNNYNVLFYAGHGVPAADGGLLFLRSDAAMNGTELAQVLTRRQVKLAVFNTCWGAQPDHDQDQQAIPRSSLAEVLIHHGVPAVLGMRDSIADREALSFIQALAHALAERSPIDEAVAIARQHLLTLYKFNQPAWTLPVLYMHPEFDGELIKPIAEGMTQIPIGSQTWLGRQVPKASLRSLDFPNRSWPIRGGMMRVGSLVEENDLVIQEPGVSRKHAEILYRDSFADNSTEPTYFLRDFSRYGTLMSGPEGRWHKIHHQEVPLRPKTQIRFGSSQNQSLEFLIEG